MFIVILMVITAVIAWAVWAGLKAESNRLAKIEARRLEIMQQYGSDEAFASDTDGSLIAFSFDRGVIVLGDLTFAKEYMFSEVSSVEMLRNGASITSTNRGSQLIGAAVGGIAFGGLGMLAGALSGSSKTVERVRDITMKITVDDNVRPIHVLKIYQSTDPKGVDPNSLQIKPHIEKADRINAHMVNGIRKADKVRELPAPASVPLLASSYGDQVRQLWELHQVGALTLEEYQDQKARLSQSA